MSAKCKPKRSKSRTHKRESRERRLDPELLAELRHGDRMLATVATSFPKVCVLSKAAKAR